MLLDLETSEAWMNRLARCEIYHKRDISIAEAIEQIDQVTLDNVHAQAREYLHPERLTLTLLGEPPVMSDYQALIAP
jgi:predicted Zn-dependent peptidase